MTILTVIANVIRRLLTNY